MEKKIITVSRQFGSAGRSIGKKVAEQLNVPYYDKELIKQVAAKTGFAPEYIENIGEYAPSKSIFAYALSFPMGSHSMGNGMSASDFLWVMQRQVILDLAEKGPCVIVGRSANYVLQDNPNVVNVFLQADLPDRVKRAIDTYGQDAEGAEALVVKTDKRRANYYNYFTGGKWGKAENYDLILNTSRMDLDKIVEVIKAYVSLR